jgi:hypothetical protein
MYAKNWRSFLSERGCRRRVRRHPGDKKDVKARNVVEK